MLQKPVVSWILYGVCIYISYLYVVCLTEGYNLMLLLAFSALFYLDLLLLLLGGIITGTLLILTQKRFNKILGEIMIVVNLALTPYLFL
ncbi:hypothetical protein [Mucilaginibacter terrae]|uniref:Uncharacterized protein n=1 Tax=Mucilaginibacter terrae TaxID=1955052 RepID=A0ABU3GVN6_9SPHI|nr:hypothetical protein [Mucilaginibacter terrae]MDT3403661.1 hypothetical protein [Mucilaginibacter terrae]